MDFWVFKVELEIEGIDFVIEMAILLSELRRIAFPNFLLLIRFHYLFLKVMDHIPVLGMVSIYLNFLYLHWID